MKVLISSKSLSNALSKIDFKTDSVYNVTLENSELSINTQTQSLMIYVVVLEFEADWINKLVSAVDEQPIALEIHENCTNVIFQY